MSYAQSVYDTACLVSGLGDFGLVFEAHVVVWWQTNQSSQNIVDGSLLLEQSIHDRGLWRHKRSLAEVAEDGEDRVEVFVFSHSFGLVCDTGHEFSQNSQIEDGW